MTNKKVTIFSSQPNEDFRGLTASNITLQMDQDVSMSDGVVDEIDFFITTSGAGESKGRWVATVYDQNGLKLKELSNSIQAGQPVITLKATKENDASFDLSTPDQLEYRCAPDKFGTGGSVEISFYGKLVGSITVSTLRRYQGTAVGNYTESFKTAFSGNGVYSLKIPFKVENL
jgi:hypothetical protein